MEHSYDYCFLRHTILLQQPVSGTDDFGEPQLAFETARRVRASIEPLRGREYFAAQQIHSEITHKIVLRYLPGLAATWRVRFGTRIFQIAAARNLNEQGRWLELLCIERNPEGT